MADEKKTINNSEVKSAGKGDGKRYIPTYFGNKRFTIRYKNKNWMIIVGIIIAVAMFSNMIEAIYYLLTNRAYFDISDITTGVIGIAAGIAMIVYASNYRSKYGRYAQLINVTMGKIPIQNIAYEYPVPYDKAQRDLQKMIDNGILHGAFIDYRNGMLVLNQNNPNVEEPIDGSKRPAGGANVPGKAGAAGAGSQNAGKAQDANPFSKKNWIDLDRAAEGIDDQDIKLRVSRISSTLESIRKKGESDKKLQKDQELQKFIGFYVPKIVDLLGQYGRLEKVKGLDDKDKLKSNLVDTLDALDHASMNLWNEMISSDVINISTELDALNKKLVIDGLGDSDFTVEGGKDGR